MKSIEIILSIGVFTIGLLGIVYSYKNFLVTMFCIELMYLGITLVFALTGNIIYVESGQIWSIVYLVIAASDSAIGLGLLIVLYRYGRTINHEDYQLLRG